MFRPQTTETTPVLPRLAAEYPAHEMEVHSLPDAVMHRRDDYLDRVMAPLTRLLPFARRQEFRLEMRQHLDAMMNAYQELGEAPEAACEKALAQFGTPEEVSESIKKSSVYPTRWQRMRAWCAQPRMSIAGAIPFLILASALCFGVARPLTQAPSIKPTEMQVASVGGKPMINGVPFSHRAAVISDKIPCTACHAGGSFESPQETQIRAEAAIDIARVRAAQQARLRELQAPANPRNAR